MVDALGSAEHPFTAIIPREHYQGPTTITLVSKSEPGGTVIKHELKFAGPNARLLAEDAAAGEGGE